jgi:hypothetical protein
MLFYNYKLLQTKIYLAIIQLNSNAKLIDLLTKGVVSCQRENAAATIYTNG